jgi:hypothetical protein
VSIAPSPISQGGRRDGSRPGRDGRIAQREATSVPVSAAIVVDRHVDGAIARQ